MSDALQEFKNVNKRYPNKVIIYRDGVGQSQQSAVLTHELPQIQQAFKNMDDNHGDKIKLMVVLVNKRVSQRFFNCENPQRLMNPQPGTIVDSQVVANDTYDFFLVS
jgi:aubergine-like protein